MEMTLALIKPDAIQHADAIMDAATDNGFVILRVRSTAREQAREWSSSSEMVMKSDNNRKCS